MWKARLAEAGIIMIYIYALFGVAIGYALAAMVIRYMLRKKL